jgi:hypothetical protein
VSSNRTPDSVTGNPQEINQRPVQAPKTPDEFKNDPDDPNNPNEVIEEFKEKIRPTPL